MLRALLLATLVLFFATTVSAQSLIPDPIGELPGDTGTTATFVIEDIILLALSIVGIIAVAFLIYGGFRYITSAGNDEVAESAKKIIQNAIIGLIVIILSYIIVVVVINALVRSSV